MHFLKNKPTHLYKYTKNRFEVFYGRVYIFWKDHPPNTKINGKFIYDLFENCQSTNFLRNQLAGFCKIPCHL